jgi:hypothetical protein
MVEDIGGQIDNGQYGSLEGTSTTPCLLDLIHNWLSKMDNSGKIMILEHAFWILAKLSIE